MKLNNACAGAAPVSQATSLVSDEWRRPLAQAGLHAGIESCCMNITFDDLALLTRALRPGATPMDCKLRVIDPLKGARRLRMLALRPLSRHLASGLLLDVTFARQDAAHASA